MRKDKEMVSDIGETKWGEGMIVESIRKNRAKKMVNELLKDDELLKEFNYLMRKEKLKKIQNDKTK